MAPAFVAVVKVLSPGVSDALRSVGASRVLSWSEFAAGAATELGDGPAVLLGEDDAASAFAPNSGAVPFDDVCVVLELLAETDPVQPADPVQADDPAEPDDPAQPIDSAQPTDPASLLGAGVVIVTTGPVTDTLKRVDAAGSVRGTAERDEHRFVRMPIAARLPVLRAVLSDVDPAGPSVPRLLTALAGRGVTVIGVRS
jgi:hypothetical protein